MTSDARELTRKMWKARAAGGERIPRVVIVEYDLDRCFKFKPAGDFDYYVVVRDGDD